MYQERAVFKGIFTQMYRNLISANCTVLRTLFANLIELIKNDNGSLKNPIGVNTDEDAHLSMVNPISVQSFDL